MALMELQCEGWGVTAYQLDLSTLTPLPSAGCGQLQIGVAHQPITLEFGLSGRIAKVVAPHAAVVRSGPAEVALIYTMYVALRGYCP